MNKRILSSVIAGSCCVTLLSLQTVSAQVSKFYVRGDVGGNVTQDADLKEFFGPVTPGSKVTFDPGVNFDLAAGYDFTDWFAAEAQTGLLANRIHGITGATTIHDASLANVPLLFNVRFQCPQPWRLTPYVGGGAGISSSIIDADHITIGGTSLHGNQADVVFAAQAFGGLRYRLNNRMAVGLEYRYFFTGDPKWDADHTSGTATDSLQFSGAQTHSVSASFQFKF